MARTVMDLDPELLQKAKAATGARTNVAVVRIALEQLLKAEARRALVERLRSGVTLDPDEDSDVDAARERQWSRSD